MRSQITTVVFDYAVFKEEVGRISVGSVTVDSDCAALVAEVAVGGTCFNFDKSIVDCFYRSRGSIAKSESLKTGPMPEATFMQLTAFSPIP